MPMAVAAPLISGGLGLVGSLFGQKKQTVQGPSYTPQQQAIQSQLGGQIQSDLSNPANLDPQKAMAVGQINTNTDNLQSRLQSTESARGFGGSGRLGLKSSQLEIGRSNQLGGLEDQFAQMQLDQNNKVRSQAQQFGFDQPTQTTTQSGSGLAAGLGSASESMSTMYYLNHLLKQPPTASPGSYDVPYQPNGAGMQPTPIIGDTPLGQPTSAFDTGFE